MEKKAKELALTTFTVFEQKRQAAAHIPYYCNVADTTNVYSLRNGMSFMRGDRKPIIQYAIDSLSYKRRKERLCVFCAENMEDYKKEEYAYVTPSNPLLSFVAAIFMCEKDACREAAGKYIDYVKTIGCDTCGSKNPGYRCPTCKERLYCCRECQKQDWPSHKITCHSPDE